MPMLGCKPTSCRAEEKKFGACLLACVQTPPPLKKLLGWETLSPSLSPRFFFEERGICTQANYAEGISHSLVQNSHWVPTSHWKIRTPDARYEWKLNLKYGWCFVNTLYSWLHVFEIYGWWFANAQCWIIEVEYWTVNASIYSKQQSFKQILKKLKACVSYSTSLLEVTIFLGGIHNAHNAILFKGMFYQNTFW